MENERAFEADADVDALVETGQDSPENTGKNLMLVTEGGVGSSTNDRSDATEQSPLINRGPGDDEPEDTPWLGRDDFVDFPWWRRPSVYWLLPMFAAYALAYGGIIVPKLNLILTLVCREYMSEQVVGNPSLSLLPVVLGDNNRHCEIPEVQSRVAQFTLYGNLISGLLAAIVSPKLGALSDRYGRKSVLIYCSAGMFVTEIITICAANYPESFPVYWLLVGYFFEGLCGSFIASMAISNSYAADCTPPAKRNVIFAWFQGCLFMGIAGGPILAGYLIKKTGHVVTVFYVALAIHVVFIFFLAFIVPESLSQRRQMAAREKYQMELEQMGPAADWINQLRSFNLFAPLKILWPTGPGTSKAVRRNLVLLASVDTIVFGVAMGAMTVVVIYTGYMFHWGNFESSRFVSIVNTCRVTCLLVLLPLITRVFRGKASRRQHGHSGADRFDLYLIRFAVFMDLLGFVGYTLARTGPLFTLSGAIASIGGMGSPILQSTLTKHVPHDRVGQLLGATGLLHALARIGGPTIFNGIYSATVGKFDQAVFVCLAAAFGLALICACFVRPGVHFDDVDPDHEVEREDDSDQSARRRMSYSRRASNAVSGFFTTVSESVFLGFVAALNFAFGSST